MDGHSESADKLPQRFEARIADADLEVAVEKPARTKVETRESRFLYLTADSSDLIGGSAASLVDLS